MAVLNINDIIERKEKALFDFEKGKIDVRELYVLMKSFEAISKDHTKTLGYYISNGQRYEMEFFQAYKGAKLIDAPNNMKLKREKAKLVKSDDED